MTSKSILLWIISMALAVSLLPAQERPNVIVIVSDDQGYGDLSCHGNPIVRTPHLDRLHDESIRFTDFHVAPMCTPTRGQLMTGVDALRNGAMNVSSGRTLLRTEFPTLPELYKKIGYQTALFGKWHLGDNYPFRPQDRGFDESLWFPSSHIGSVPDAWNNDYFDDSYLHNGQPQKYQGYTTDVFFREAMQWIKKQRQDKQPFFVYLPTAAPHSPLYVPEKYRQAVRPRLEAALPNLPKLSEEEQENLTRFLGMIENIDENMGLLQSFLHEEKLSENTILVFLTDNGSTMGHKYFNAGMKGSKTTLWEGGHRVPLFIKWPKGHFGQPRDITGLSQVQDLLPTLLDLCSAKAQIPQKQDGMSLAPILQGQTSELPERMLVINYSRMPFKAVAPSDNSPSIPKKEGAAVLWKNWRLLEDHQLYDLTHDPLQTKDVSATHQRIVEKMHAHLEAWWLSVKDRANEPQRIPIGVSSANSTLLTACEWWDVFVDQQSQIRRGENKNSHWNLEIENEGEYEFELRRWPKDSGLSLNASAPEERVTDGTLPEGKALSIRQASLQIQGQQMIRDVQINDEASIFQAHLAPGSTKLKTAFLTSDGEPVCGAYYVIVKKL